MIRKILLFAALAVAALIVMTARDIWRRGRCLKEEGDGTFRSIRVGATLGIVAIACQELGEFSLQMPGNVAVFAVLLAIVLAEPVVAPGPDTSPRLVARPRPVGRCV